MATSIFADRPEIEWKAGWSGEQHSLIGLRPFFASVWHSHRDDGSWCWRAAVNEMKFKKTFESIEEAKEFAEKAMAEVLRLGADHMAKFLEDKQSAPVTSDEIKTPPRRRIPKGLKNDKGD